MPVQAVAQAIRLCADNKINFMIVLKSDLLPQDSGLPPEAFSMKEVRLQLPASEHEKIALVINGATLHATLRFDRLIRCKIPLRAIVGFIIGPMDHEGDECRVCGMPSEITTFTDHEGNQRDGCPFCIDAHEDVVQANQTTMRLVGEPTFDGIRERVEGLMEHGDVDSVNVYISQESLDRVAELMAEAGYLVGPGGFLDVKERRFLGGRLFIREDLDCTAILEAVCLAAPVEF